MTGDHEPSDTTTSDTTAADTTAADTTAADTTAADTTASDPAVRARMSGPGRWGSALWALASVPILALLLLGMLALRVRLSAGAWPRYNAPDPKSLGFHYMAVVAAFIGAFVSVVVTPPAALAAHLTGRRAGAFGPVILAAVGFLVYVLVLRFDVGGLGTWFAD